MLHDITRPLAAGTAPWPGDTPFSLRWTWTQAAGAAVNVSAFTMSPHTGTHADAPYHCDAAAPGMDAVGLAPYLGPCRVADLSGRAAVTAADLGALDLTGVRRLLVRTGSNPAVDRFNPGFTWLEPVAAEVLAALGVMLFGTDAPSVDPYDSQDLPAHRALGRGRIAILENLWLDAVAPGDYELIALPLRLAGADAAPIRAVLRALD